MKVRVAELTREKISEMLKQADSSVLNQWRVDKQGNAFISQAVGAEQLENIQFYFETTDYVGQAAADDSEYVNMLYNNLTNFWKYGYTNYLDFSFADVQKKKIITTNENQS